jgi:metal-dependent amidase/aminoacylase/carboxypeptidase family protein
MRSAWWATPRPIPTPAPRAEDGQASVPLSNNGRVGKLARYVGRAAHAGGAPHMGVNALYAAHIGLMAINALRETFKDDDTIRVHPILTHGGAQVNVIPAEARIETYVRGRTLDAVIDANAKVDRALRAGALALGATVEIDTLPGYLPLDGDRTMARYFKDNAVALVGTDQYREAGHRAGSTDMGDLSQVMPVLHPYMGGARGTGHAADFEIADPMLAYVAPAKALAMMVVDMLADDGAGAREVLAKVSPRLSRTRYLELQRGMARREVYPGAHP